MAAVEQWPPRPRVYWTPLRHPLKLRSCHPQEPPESGSKKTGAGKILRRGRFNPRLVPRQIHHRPLSQTLTRFYLGCNVLTICSSCDMTCRLKCRSLASHLGMLKLGRLAELHIFQLQVDPSLVWTMHPCLGPRAWVWPNPRELVPVLSGLGPLRGLTQPGDERHHWSGSGSPSQSVTLVSTNFAGRGDKEWVLWWWQILLAG